MSPSAQRAQLDFVRLAAEEPSSLYFEEFLRHGYEAWPTSDQARFPGLATWYGVAGLKQSLQRLAGAPADWSVLLASRSLSLVKLAARRMFGVCCNVLTTDLSWPTYQQVVERRASHTGKQVTVVRIRDHILYRQWTTADVARYLAAAFVDADCDGLFLPAMDHLGIRLPIRDIVAAIRRHREAKFCFVDAAQAFCQVPINDCFDFADFIVAGSHKWMGAYLPAGIAFIGQESRIRGAHVDPLLRFTEQLASGELDGHSETVNLTPLFACAGAAAERHEGYRVDDAITSFHSFRWLIPPSLQNWHLVSPAAAMRSRILLFETCDRSLQGQTAETIRRRWFDAGCVVTAYSGGRVRVAIPHEHVADRRRSPRKRESQFHWAKCP